jgi:hypothetical protein
MWTSLSFTAASWAVGGLGGIWLIWTMVNHVRVEHLGERMVFGPPLIAGISFVSSVVAVVTGTLARMGDRSWRTTLALVAAIVTLMLALACAVLTGMWIALLASGGWRM